MENDIALMTTGYIALRVAILVVFGYVVYRVLRPAQGRVQVRSRKGSNRD